MIKMIEMISKRVSIVAGGWSFEGVDHAKLPGIVIAINDSGIWLNKLPDYILSMDRLWTEGRWERLCGLSIQTYLRRDACKNVLAGNRPWCRQFNCDIRNQTFSSEYLTLNGDNSGTCGLNLSWQMKPKELFLFGFDMCRSPDGKPYWYPPYAWASSRGGTSGGKYKAWAKRMKAAADQFAAIGTRVFNVSPKSAIECFEKVSAKELGIAL